MSELELQEGGGESHSLSNPFLHRVDMIFTFIAGIVLFLMMVMTSLDVIGRYLFSAPLGFAYEMTQIGMATMVFCALPSVTLRFDHVTVDLLDNIFSPGFKAVRDVLVTILIIGACLFLAWRLGKFAGRLLDYSEHTSVLEFPIGIAAAIGAGMLTLTAIFAAISLFVSGRKVKKGTAQ